MIDVVQLVNGCIHYGLYTSINGQGGYLNVTVTLALKGFSKGRLVNPKTAEGGQFDPPPRGFSKNVSYKEKVKP